jgi:type I restriction enzyme S subunit
MALSRYKIGDLIEQTVEINSALEFGKSDVRGMTITKDIIPTKANVDETSCEKYFIVRPYDFIYNPRTHGKKIGLGFNNSKTSFIITWNNVAFRIKENEKTIILPLYLFLYFNRSEWDREACFNSWGSSTEVFTWESFCDMNIKLPDITIQQKYVDVYNTILVNLRVYENSLENLNTVIAVNIEEFKHTVPRVAVGELLEEIDSRNRTGVITDVKGININKEFMPSVANLSETDLTKYKVIEKNQFAYSAMQTGRDECIRIALFHEEQPAIISPAYTVFQVKSKKVLSEYVMLWFSRKESDRYGWFISDSSIRASLEFSRFCEIDIPLPSLSQQQAVVNFYNARRLIQRNTAALGNMLKNICPVLIRGAMEEGI